MRKMKRLHTCFYCGGDIEEKKIQHIHHWRNRFILFDKLPAEVCRQCGEVFLAPPVLKKIDAVTQQADLMKKKIEIPIYSFSKVACL